MNQLKMKYLITARGNHIVEGAQGLGANTTRSYRGLGSIDTFKNSPALRFTEKMENFRFGSPIYPNFIHGNWRVFRHSISVLQLYIESFQRTNFNNVFNFG